MRTFVVAALSTVAFARRGHGRLGGRWWGAAPECAHSCLSSAYAEGTMTDDAGLWPTPGAFCDADKERPLHDCMTASCVGDESTAYESMSSLSSSLCAVYTQCLESTDAVYTITVPTPTGTTGRYWEYGPWRTYTGDGVVTVTGCPTGGLGVGYGGRGGYGYGGGYGGRYGGYGQGYEHGRGYGHVNPWGGVENPDDCFWGWGYGWSDLTTVTSTATKTGDEVVVETYAQAVSEGTTTTTPIGVEEGEDFATDEAGPAATGAPSPGENGDGNSGVNKNGPVVVLGAALGAVVAVAGLL